jgi:hypothetical protein
MQQELAEWLVSVRDDPYAFVMGAFPWGAEGTQLEAYDGPMPWARNLMERVRLGLLNPQEAILEAVASGHGIAKSTTVSHLVLWAFCTFPDCRGVVTANTETQLKTKTWAELGKWFNLLNPLIREHFQLNATSLISKDKTTERTWRIDMIPWSKTNPQAFAGLHNKGNRLILIFDEASEIEDIIWETAEGAFSDADTQLMWFAFGNPTRNIGRFRECFDGGQHHSFWHTTQIDSREVPITNKKRLEHLIRVYGEDNDYVRIRILGQFPRQGLMEFFIAADIDAAMSPDREVHTDITTPLAIGVDVARYGANNSVIFPRRGRDARTLARKVFHGLSTVELANHVFNCWHEWHPDGIFIDEGGVGGGVVDNCRARQLHVMGIQFGGKDDITGVMFDNAGEHYANKRTAMYGAARAWLRNGGILPNDPDLRTAMLAIRYTFNKKGEIQLVGKEELLDDNPGLVLDDLDAFCLTFGGPLAPKHIGPDPRGPLHLTEYNPFDPEHMEAA